MNTVALIDHILLVLGNLGGIFEFANTRVFPFVEENALVLFLVCWITLILVLIYKGPGPAESEKKTAIVSRETVAVFCCETFLLCVGATLAVVPEPTTNVGAYGFAEIRWSFSCIPRNAGDGVPYGRTCRATPPGVAGPHRAA